MRTCLSLLLTSAAALAGSALPAQDPRPPVDSTVIPVAGSTEVRVWTDRGTPRAAVTRDGGHTWRALAKPEWTLSMQYGEWDPAFGEPPVPPALAADAANRLFLVQFRSPIIDEYRVALRRLGAEIHTYMPFQSYIARMDRQVAEQIRALPFVRAVVDYHPAFRMEPAILADLAAGARLDRARYNMLLIDYKRDAGELERAITAAGGTVDMAADGGSLVSATLTHEQLLGIVQSEVLMWIDRWTPIEKDMNNALAQSGAAVLHSLPTPIDGKGMRAHIAEGIRETHQEFQARPPYRTAPIFVRSAGNDSHGTNTAGEVFAMGGFNPNVKGGVPFAQALYTLNTGNRYTLTQELVNSTNRVTGTTASWGNARTTTYTSVSSDTDRWIFDFNLFTTQSQSNSGGTPSRPQAWAKNICSVGGFLHRNNANPADDCWCGTGSTGPCNDGRIGPTLAGYYDSINTTSSGSNTAYTTGFGGTSGATPMVQGFAQLTMQMFTEGLFGYPAGTWQTRFEDCCKYTTTKALLAATTRQVVQASRYQQGWGFPSVADMYALRDRMLVLDEEDVLEQGDERTYFVFKPGNGEPLRVAMQYADPPANAGANPQRINSLDLKLVDPNGTVYWGNNGLIPPTALPVNAQQQGTAYHWSTPGGVANDRDTQECVFLWNPPGGVYAVTVSAPAIRQDAHVETPAVVDADFALVVAGIGGGRSKSGMVLDLVSSTPGEFRIDVQNVPASGWTSGRTFFSLDTSRHPSLGNLFGLELDILALSIFTLPPTPGGVFSFTNAGAGVYPNVAFDFPAGLAAAVQGLTFDAVVVLQDSQGATVDVSNVDRVTVQ